MQSDTKGELEITHSYQKIRQKLYQLPITVAVQKPIFSHVLSKQKLYIHTCISFLYTWMIIMGSKIFAVYLFGDLGENWFLNSNGNGQLV